MALVEMVLDGTPMMVPEEDCHWIKKDDKLHKIFTLGGGYSLFEFEGLTGTFEERLTQVKNNRVEQLPVETKKPSKKTTSDWLFDN